MMTKMEHINYWKSLSDEDFDAAIYNMEGGQNLPALFFFHLSLEKMLTAHWIKDNLNNTPNFANELQKIASETHVRLESVHVDFLHLVTTWDIKAKHPDTNNNLKKLATNEYTYRQSKKVKNLLGWLESQL